MSAGTSDVLVVGDGPAGLAAAAALADRGVEVTLLAAPRDATWPNVYGVWVDEIDDLGLPLDRVLARRWASVTVDGLEARHLARAYGVLENAALEVELRARGAAGGMRTVTGRAVGVTSDVREATVSTAEGTTLRARAVVDASGFRPALVTAGRGRPPAFQTAFGLRGRFSAPPVEPGSMVLMDFRDAHLDAPTADPTFLYGMDLGDGRAFVEETSLARRPGLPLDELERRLRARLAARGVEVLEVEAVERCAFPMGGPLPPRGQRVIAFGGAAGMVHPATGYQVGTALRRAPALAAALSDALAAPDADGDTVAAAGWAAVWPVDLVRQRTLHTFGLETLLGFDGPTLRSFFDAFFTLPAPRWTGYLSGAPSSRQLAGSMLRLFATADPRLRGALARSAIGPNRALLRRALA